ncbi:MAG TPA: tetratricopeptide repeat protein [Candidatus Acidoferrum sp.]|jgi:cytochrome c-type biogenesis protein CcmH/NrfG
MVQEPKSPPAITPATWPTNHVSVLAVASLVVGLVAGYLLLRGGPANPAKPAVAAAAPKLPGAHPPMTMEQMKAMADRKAVPLLEKLKANPKDATALTQLGALYSSAHQFPQSADYYRKALESDPKNVATRAQLASSLYYGGDVDDALQQLQQVLKTDPKNANALFNLGMMKWKGKDDAAGAIATWQELLRSNPNLDRKSTVEQMIAEAKSQPVSGKPGSGIAP